MSYNGRREGGGDIYSSALRRYSMQHYAVLQREEVSYFLKQKHVIILMPSEQKNILK